MKSKKGLCFAENAGHLLIDKIKAKSGCSICERENDPAELIFWSLKIGGPVDDKDANLMHHADVLDLGVACLDCVVHTLQLEIPPLK